VHHLRDIDPDVAFIAAASESDPSRPLELLTIVLRAAVQGLLKCCDCTWRELAKGGAYDVGFFVTSYNVLLNHLADGGLAKR